MTATKYTVVVTCEVLSLDVVPSLLADVIKQMQNEVTEGMHRMDDGDQVDWDVTSYQINL